MFIAHRAAEIRVHEVLAGSGAEQLTHAQMRLVQRLAPGGIRLTDLAEQARVTKQTAGALVDDLVRQGFVERTPDPTDARARLVVMTDKGLELCGRAAAELESIERDWREHLGDERYGQLRAALLSLREITDPWL